LRKSYNIIPTLIFLLSCSLAPLHAQDTTSVVNDSSPERKLNPMRATMLAASLPGLGQVYNRKYWKIPIVYAGFGGLGYAVYYNTKYYNQYTKAYQDFTDLVPETDSYADLIRGIPPEEYDPVLFPDDYNPSTASWIEDQLLRQVDYFRKYRDLSYIGIAAWYLITIVDANVDASLIDYEVTENLNFTVAPVMVPLYYGSGMGVNVSMRINF
jgi:hypothetical protein